MSDETAQKPADGKGTGITKVWQYFKSSFAVQGLGLTAFKNEWMALADKDRDDLRIGIEDGSLTY